MGGGGSKRQNLARKTVDEKQKRVAAQTLGGSFAARDLQCKLVLEKCKLAGQRFLNCSGTYLKCGHTSSQHLSAEPKKPCITTAALCVRENSFTSCLHSNSFLHLKSLTN